MAEKIGDPAVANQVELAVRRLDSLSTLPCVVERVFSQLLKSKSISSALVDIVESDPVLTVKILSAFREQRLSFVNEKPSVRRALGRLPENAVRDALLSVGILPTSGGFNHESGSNRLLLKKELVRHCLAVACCAQEIANSAQMDSQLAYSAGLLHDIGKFALEETMPKSFALIVGQASSENCPAWVVEQRHLSLDHTLVGKRAAQKWHLGEQITLAIWLHHSDTVMVSGNIPEAKIAQVVQLADSVAYQCGLGFAGSFERPESAEQIAESLKIEPEKLEQIRRDLPEQVEQRSKVLGLDLPNAEAACFGTVHSAAVLFAKENSKLSQENRRLQTTSSYLNFIMGFLSDINANNLPIEIAENFAVRWQRFYQTGMVCLYLPDPAGTQKLEAVLAETIRKSKVVHLNAPGNIPVIPETIANKFEILDAQDYTGWLFEQLDVDFELSQTKLVPLLAGGRALGAMLFELRYPSDTELFREDFKSAVSVAGCVLDMAFACRGQERFAEQFARMLSTIKSAQRQSPAEASHRQIEPQAIATPSFTALAEMAGGAAHELNNPLSVIAGRAQLLAQSETDPEKKRILTQIRENTHQVTAIIEDLMAYARPQPPRPAQTDVKKILDEAVQFAGQKANTEHINVQLEVADDVGDVFVDSGQIVSAIANVICNSLESYTDKIGPIKLDAQTDISGGSVRMQISDLGRGMDGQTVEKATQPFFSARPAGRGRGMGLAHARRLVELNKGTLQIKSQPGEGTTVTIFLPCK